MKKLLILTAITGLLSSFNLQADVYLYIVNLSKDITKDIAAFLNPRPDLGGLSLMYLCEDTAKVPDDFISDVFSSVPTACSTTFRVSPFDMSTTPGVKPTESDMTALKAEKYKEPPFYLQVWADAIDTTGDTISVGAAPTYGDPTQNQRGLAYTNPIVFPGMWSPFPATGPGTAPGTTGAPITFTAQEISDASSDTTAIRKKVIDAVLSVSPNFAGMAFDFYLRPVKIFYGKPFIFMSDFQGPFKDGEPTGPDLSGVTNYTSLQTAASGYTISDIAGPGQYIISGRTLADYAQDPLAPAGYVAAGSLDLTSLQTAIPTDILQSGSFGTITNKPNVSFTIKDTLFSIVPSSTTDTKKSWATRSFNGLWDSNNQIVFEPSDPTFPTFTFTFEGTYIQVERSNPAASWKINLYLLTNPATGVLKLLNIPLPNPLQWSLDFTIDENWNFIVDTLNLECHSYATVVNPTDASKGYVIQDTMQNIVLTADKTTQSITVDGTQTQAPTDVTTPNATGGLCKTGIFCPSS